MSCHSIMSQRNVTDIILQNDVAGPSDIVCSTDTSGLYMTTRLFVMSLTFKNHLNLKMAYVSQYLVETFAIVEIQVV